METERMQNGISLLDSVINDLKRLAESFNISFS
jgi:hypothetical protein